jgi:Fe-S-cluster containining protein
MNKISMESKNNYNNALKSIGKISDQIISCKGCTKCCENGVVYVMPEEIEGLIELGVPLIEIEGINIIQRNKGGACPMLDKVEKKCKIYDQRPYCCRAFPTDVFYRNGKLEWGVYTYCPDDRIKPIAMKDGKAELDLDILYLLLSRYEKELPPKFIQFFKQEDEVCSKIELLDNLKDEYKIIANLEN